MSPASRVALAAGILVLDFVAFAVPIVAIVAAYVIVARPAAFLEWVVRLYDDRLSPG